MKHFRRIRTQSSFWDKDVIPVYKSDDTEEYYFSGKRIHRGQYRTANGQVLNADVNGALNILRKSSVVDVNILYSRGEVDTQQNKDCIAIGGDLNINLLKRRRKHSSRLDFKYEVLSRGSS